MTDRYNVLETCLKELDNGTDIDTLLRRYPDLSGEFRPILEAALTARKMSVQEPSPDVAKRNKEKVLGHIAVLREKESTRNPHFAWPAQFRRTVVSLSILILLFASGTRLVSASSNTVPGDRLYSLKRGWEDISLFFTFDTARYHELELEYENERLEELHELFAEGRAEKVDFSGYVTRMSDEEWRVSGVTVLISVETILPKSQTGVGSAVIVTGQILDAKYVVAERIELLPPGANVPKVEDDEGELEKEGFEDSNEEMESESGNNSVNEASSAETSQSVELKGDTFEISIEGRISAIQNNFIVVNGVVMDLRIAEIKGTPKTGVPVKVKGYYDTSGVFIVTEIEFLTGGSDEGISSDNANDDESSTNVNVNDNDNDNEHDSNDNDDNLNNGD